MLAVFHIPFVSKYLGLTTPHLNQDWVKRGNGRDVTDALPREPNIDLHWSGCSTQCKAEARVLCLAAGAHRLQEYIVHSEIASALRAKLAALSEVSCVEVERRKDDETDATTPPCTQSDKKKTAVP